MVMPPYGILSYPFVGRDAHIAPHGRRTGAVFMWRGGLRGRPHDATVVPGDRKGRPYMSLRARAHTGAAIRSWPPLRGGESRALPVADEARRTSGSGQNFGGLNAAAKFWAPQQVMPSVSEAGGENLSLLFSPSVGALRKHAGGMFLAPISAAMPP